MAALTLGACHGDRSGSGETTPQPIGAAAAAGASTASQILAAIQSQTGTPVLPAVAQSFKTATTGGLQPQFPAAAVAAEKKLASVVLPQVASGAMQLQDSATGATVNFTLSGAQPVAAQTVSGYVIYPAALAGAAILHRALPSGNEDFVYMTTRPSKPEVDYSVSLGSGIAGLRLVSGVLEFLDSTGAPRLHVSPPSIVGKDGTATDGELAVSGCDLDTDPSPPWGRAVVVPGATTCTVKVTWPDAAVSYPAILDPRWTTTGSMATARFEHTLILLSTGRALAAGGRSSTTVTTGLTSAELYDQTSGTWSATGSMTGARRLHSATQLATSSNPTTSGKILVAGGINGSSSLNTAELYSPTAGTWIAAGTMDAARHGHTATRLTDGRVLAAGGLNGTTTLTSASLYNPASGAGSWVATTGPIPPPGLKNHTATLIQTTNNQLNNKVLLVGGNNGTSTIAAVYLFDPVQNAFSTLASISSPREQHTAMTLQNTNGKILVAGGKNGSTVLSSAIVFDPSVSNGTWSSAGTMTSPRVGHTMTLLPNTIVANGQVLVTGGTSNGTTLLSSAELFSGTSTWTATPSMPGTLQGHQAVLLSGNMILAAGGLSSSTTVQNAAYLYDASFGLACSSNSQCASGFCANGVCCNSACNGGSCGACNLAGSLGTCTALTAGTVCRAQAGSCDVAETCNGTSFACPADTFQPSTYVCRAAAGECDAAETCTGTSATCPSDSKKPVGTPCTDDGNPCSLDQCDGTNVTCQHPAGNAGAVCRATAGDCDVAETCTGTSTTCPADGFKPSTTVCRASTNVCDPAESCTGTSAACPADGKIADGTSCNDGNACVTGKVCESGQCSDGQTTTCTGTGTTTTVSVGTSGGTVALEKVTVTFPQNVFTSATGITITSTTDAPPSGIQAYTPIYKFDPDGSQFKLPATVTFVVGTGLLNPTILWSRPGGGWDDLRGTYINGAITATITHFSEGFVAVSQCAGQADGTICTAGTPERSTCQAQACVIAPIKNLPTDNLGTLGGASSAFAVNPSGSVVGQFYTASGAAHAFLWVPGGSMSDIGSEPEFPASSSATAINTLGVMAGSLPQPDSSSHAFSYAPPHQFADLGVGADNTVATDPFSGFTYQGAYGAAINDSGQVAGKMTSGGQVRGFLYTPGGTFVDIGALGGGWTWATGVSRTGAVVGSSQVANTPSSGYARFGHAAIYKDGLPLIDMNDLIDPTQGITLIKAEAIVDNYIVGGAQGTGPVIPFRFDSTTLQVEPIATGWEGDAVASAVNNVGEVVGFGAIDAAGTQLAAFIYTDQLGFRKLNDLIPPNSGWNLVTAAGINDSGDIVGWGYYNGAQLAYRLRVSPETIACNGQTTNPGPVCIWADGVIQQGDQYLAVFGYQNTGTTTVKPSSDQELINGQTVPDPVPAPPAQFPPGNYPGAFLPTVTTGSNVSWAVNGQTVTVYAPYARQLTTNKIGDSGTGVEVEDTEVAVIPDTAQYGVPPQSPPVGQGPSVGAQYYGALQGSLNVSASGAATYTVPITLPPGVAGMAPKLSLAYSSQAGNGIAGQGWSLTGLSMITRCPTTRIQDGVAKAVGMGLDFAGEATDGLCLDGKRMFETEANSYNGYDKYRLETGDFSSITGYISTPNGVSGHATFKVMTKTGEARYYGLRPESRVTAPLLEGDPAGVVAVWALDRVEDQWGNYYDIFYNDNQKDFTDRGLIVTSIAYTGHRDGSGSQCNSGSPTSICPPNTVTFSYEFRPDHRTTRFHTSFLIMSQRLTTITTPIGTYSLAYAADDPLMASRLQSIGYCALPTTTNPTGVCGQTTPKQDSLNFGWSPDTYGWQQNTAYELPVTLNLKGSNYDKPNGVQFSDLDGDGRVDLIQSLDATSDGTYAAADNVWRNTGQGWAAVDAAQLGNASWQLKTNLFGSDSKQKAVLVDIDGDGIVDEVAKGSDGKTVGYLNRIKQGQGWTTDFGLLDQTFPASWGSLHLDRQSDGTIDTLIDMNGDGRVDVVRQTPPNTVQVLFGTPVGWSESTVSYDIPTDAGSSVMFTLQDTNRDGLPDLVAPPPAENYTGWTVLINQGTFVSGVGMWRKTTVNEILPSNSPNLIHNADLDGDGYDDIFEYYEGPAAGGPLGTSKSAVLFGTGTGYSSAFNGSWIGALSQYGMASSAASPGVGFLQIADVNGDGLVDAIMPWGSCASSIDCDSGRLLINTGLTWSDPTDLGGQGNYTLPKVPAPNNSTLGSAFVDLNGDGLVDIVQNTDYFSPAKNKVWLNTFQRPIITDFPNGQASPTHVDYSITTMADAQAPGGVYDDASTISVTNTKFMATPLQVAKTVSVDAGVGGGQKAVTSYHYSSLRAAAAGRGPQGFASVTSTDPLGMVTKTTYAQMYPFTGLPTGVTKSYTPMDDHGPPIQYAQTNTHYCAYKIGSSGAPGTWPSCNVSVPDNPQTSYFVYPAEIDDTNYLEIGNSADRVATNPYVDTTTSYTYDDQGNPTLTQIETKQTTPQTDPQQPPLVEDWWKTVANDYGPEGSETQMLGRPRTTTTNTWRQLPTVLQTKTHVTVFGYGAFSTAYDEFTGLGYDTGVMDQLDKEAGAKFPLELMTAYGHDPFGNVTTTTECDHGNFGGDCIPGATGPASNPFRTSTVSYYPSDFVAPTGDGLVTSIPYGPGRFPVMTTNAMGHTQYFVYDPKFGALRQATDPNGISTCFDYDPFGTKTLGTDRCGSSNPLTSSTIRYLPGDPAAPATAGAITVASPPDGHTTWTYTDLLGRQIETLTRNFGGSLTQTITNYNQLGQVWTKAQPFIVGQAPHFGGFVYDGLNRMTQASQDLGDIGTGGAPSSVKNIQYQGSTVTTTEIVRGDLQQKIETKNAIGKLATLQDTYGDQTTFLYDADGNLTDIYDPANNHTIYVYDNRGRKTEMTDPDMGHWTYAYDGFGQLTSQVDATLQTTSLTYDAIGRMTSRTDSSGTAEWVYDNTLSGAAVGKLVAMVGPPDTHLEAPCSIPYVDATDGNRAGKALTYDNFGQLSQIAECVDGETFTTSFQYDALSRKSVVTYPQVDGTQLSVGYKYTDTGSLQYVTDASDGSVLWAATAVNAMGQVTAEYTRNGVTTSKTRSPVTGWLLTSTSTAQADSGRKIQGWTYQYDEAGDLMERDRSDAVNIADSTETFQYDDLNRLTKASALVLAGGGYGQSDSYGYDSLGNLTGKGAAGYSYGGCSAAGFGPHAVCSVTDGSSFVYDANGGMTSGRSRSIQYSPQRKVSHIASDPAVSQGNDTGTADFVYDADGNRVVQIATAQVNGVSTTSRTVYVGLGGTGKSMYERTTTGSTVEHVQFIYADGVHDGNAFALRVTTDNGSQSSSVATKYYHFDHLGSVTAMSDEFGRVVSTAWGGADSTLLGYDAWGARRNPEGSAAVPASFNLQVGHREFTGHETIPSVGLINMNGRVYDPTLARFLTPDSHVQAANDIQSYNRYSYVLNNPLRYTDPTGYFAWGTTFTNIATGLAIAVVSAGACAMTSGVGCALVGILASLESAAVMHAEGASVSQIVLSTSIGMMAGYLGGAVGELATAGGTSAGAQFAQSVISGEVGGAAGAVLSSVIQGKGLGWNVLEAMAEGAAMGAFGWAIKPIGPATAEADSPEQDDDQGEGTLSNAKKGRGAGKSDGPYKGASDDPMNCGDQGVVCNVDGQGNPELDALARRGLDERIHGNSVDEGDTNVTGYTIDHDDREAMTLIYRDKSKALHFVTTTGGPESTQFTYPKDADLILAVHTHPGAQGEFNTFSVGDANFAAMHNMPVYVWQHSYNEILVFTPPAFNPFTGIQPAGIRAISGD
jgi:RHS repeat-associated protein